MNEEVHKPRVRLEGNRIIKTGSKARMKIEAAKLTSAYELGKRTGLFRSPRLIDSSEDGTLVLEFVPGFRSAQVLAAYGSETHPFWAASGSALRTIHAYLDPQDCAAAPLPSLWNASSDSRCWLHGDYNLANVGYTLPYEGPVVLDWSLTPMLDSNATVGSPFFDLAWMLKSIFLLPLRMQMARGLERKADRFLGAYFQGTAPPESPEELRRLALAAAELTIARQTRNRITRYLYTRRAKRLRSYLDDDPNYRE
jgi:hypothetical protein